MFVGGGHVEEIPGFKPEAFSLRRGHTLEIPGIYAEAFLLGLLCLSACEYSVCVDTLLTGWSIN